MDVYRLRREKLQARMREDQLDWMLLTQNVDMYYFCGTMQTGFLFVPSQGEALLFVRRSVTRALQEADVEVLALTSLTILTPTLLERWSGSTAEPSAWRIATPLDVLPAAQYERLKQAIPDAVWVDGASIIREHRMIKDAIEVQAIRRSASAVKQALEEAVRSIVPGMTEVELMAAIEYRLRLQGHPNYMRMRSYNSELITGMVASGASAASPTYFDGPAGGLGIGAFCPQSSSTQAIKAGEPILLDVGCMVEGYVIDQTRTAVIGELSPKLQRAYEISEAILAALEAKLKPGTLSEEVYFLSLRMAEEAGLSEHFMGYGRDQVKFVGHGIGLEIDELPVLAKGFKIPLEPGMVIAIEPKFTFPGEGVVGVEDTYLITDEGFEKLSCSPSGLIRLSLTSP